MFVTQFISIYERNLPKLKLDPSTIFEATCKANLDFTIKLSFDNGEVESQYFRSPQFDVNICGEKELFKPFRQIPDISSKVQNVELMSKDSIQQDQNNQKIDLMEKKFKAMEEKIASLELEVNVFSCFYTSKIPIVIIKISYFEYST